MNKTVGWSKRVTAGEAKGFGTFWLLLCPGLEGSWSIATPKSYAELSKFGSLLVPLNNRGPPCNSSPKRDHIVDT